MNDGAKEIIFGSHDGGDHGEYSGVEGYRRHTAAMRNFFHEEEVLWPVYEDVAVFDERFLHEVRITQHHSTSTSQVDGEYIAITKGHLT